MKSLELPGKRYRKNKKVWIYHLYLGKTKDGRNRSGFSVKIARDHWRCPTWGYMILPSIESASRYAKRLLDALGNEQEIIEVCGSTTYRSVNVRTMEIDRYHP